jgi:hypothetical protein
LYLQTLKLFLSFSQFAFECLMLLDITPQRIDALVIFSTLFSLFHFGSFLLVLFQVF